MWVNYKPVDHGYKSNMMLIHENVYELRIETGGALHWHRRSQS